MIGSCPLSVKEKAYIWPQFSGFCTIYPPISSYLRWIITVTTLILASSSPHRKQLLERLGLPFSCFSPNVDEAPLPGESPPELAKRLAQLKASAAQQHHPQALIIGSDQVACCDGVILNKPGTAAKAQEQLRLCSSKTVRFHTGLCVLNGIKQRQYLQEVPYQVVFRPLSEAHIKRYIEKDCPLDCAGSFKSESLGISLFQSMHGEDPTALIGLPLITLTRILAAEGMDPLV